jgi:stress response protein SCP2
MSKPMILKKGDRINLPRGGVYTGGLSWAPRGGVGESPDLDFWVLRHLNTGVGQVIAWCNKDWRAPELGRNSEGAPWIATPERDVVYKGDDRTGGSGKGEMYDENIDLNPNLAPANVIGYSAFVTIYDENDEGLTLGVAEDIKCGIKDTRGREVQIALAEEHGFDVTVLVCSWTKDASSGLWIMDGNQKGFDQEDIFTVAQRDYGVVFPQSWQDQS